MAKPDDDASLPRPAADKSRVAPQRRPDRQITYKQTPHGPLLMHLYLPADFTPDDRRPAIVFFFGGGWRHGSPEQFFSKAEYFASRGLVAISVEYRVASRHEVTPDVCVLDARSAMRYVRSHAGELGIDPDRIIGSGGSAGGHLAAAAALLPGPDDPQDDATISPRPAALVLFNPVLDTMDERAVKHMPDEQAARLISPRAHLERRCPPAIVFFGSADNLLPQGQRFVEPAVAQGDRVELFIAPRMGHGFFNASPWHEASTIIADRFLTELGYLQGEATMKPADAAAQFEAAVSAGR